MTEDQKEIFEQFCSRYFPYRLNDRYQEDGYFDFRASSFIGIDNGGIDGILLRTDIPYQPGELRHIFLHELAHIFCAHNELDGKSFFDEYCMDYAPTKEEDGIINAGYAVWRECIAEIIAIELDDCCEIVPLKDKKNVIYEAAKSTLLAMQGDGKLPSLKSLQVEQERLMAEQQWLYDERAKLKKEVRLIDTMKANVDDFLSPKQIVYDRVHSKEIE